MSLLDKEQLKLAAEKGAEAAWEYAIKPAMQKLVDSTANTYDNAAFEMAKGFIESAINSISDKDGD